MRFIYQFPPRAVKHYERWTAGHELAEVAVAAEEAGFDMVSMTDHPFPEQRWLDNGGHHSLDPFVALSFMAQATSRLRLLTALLVAGYRNPYLAAKSIASLDLLSGGRLVVGMGAGYLQPEFAVLGADFTDRGPRFDEALSAMKAAWTGEPVEHDSPSFPAHGHVQLPRPAQRPHPPIWIGGNSRAARRRVAESADGWMPFQQGPEMASITGTPALDSVDVLAGHIAEIREARVAAGRTTDLDVCWAPWGHPGEDYLRALAESIPSYETAGITYILIESQARGFDACLTELELLRDNLPHPAPR
jgi:probable F420-dependent oxidoreductase